MAALCESSQLDLEKIILAFIGQHEQITDTWEFAIEHQIDHQTLIGVIKSLLADKYVLEEPLSTSFWTLTQEGEDVANTGSPEIQVLKALSEAGTSVAELNANLGEVAKLGLGVCMKNKWVQKKGDLIVAIVSNIEDETSNILKNVRDSAAAGVSEKDLQNLKKRKLVQQVTRKSYRILRGPDYREVRVRKVADLTKAMLGTKSDVSAAVAML